MTRHLRPGRIIHSGGAAWLIDESWPVALAIGDDGSTSVVSWDWQRLRPSSELDHVTVADGVGIVVRDGGQVAWVRRDDATRASVGDGLMLAAADPDTAWFIDRSFVDPGQPPEAPPPLPPGQILAVHRDGTRTQIDTAAPVTAIGIDGADMWVTLAEPPVAHRRSQHWGFGYPLAVLRVPKGGLLTTGLATAVPATGDRPARTHPRPSAWVWLEEDPALVLRFGEPAGELVWWAGAPYGSDKIDRSVVLVGSDPSSGHPQLRVDLGQGLVADLQPVGEELWVAIGRRRYLAVPRDRGVDVLAIAASGAVRTIYSSASIDISRFAPALNRPPEALIAEHINDIHHQFDHLDAYWRSEDGVTSPLSPELTEPAVSVQGEWPDTRLVVRMRHQNRPGLVLRRTLPLFDETGAPITHQNAVMALMEDLDTHYLAPAEEAVDGVLDT